MRCKGAITFFLFVYLFSIKYTVNLYGHKYAIKVFHLIDKLLIDNIVTCIFN